ncbi:hypothetical protein FGO68_gene7529 [Halteria grandinella]|uniref:Uncharacterized protein n=1 Tax=Halteria grandinella TaxID=5974 RepID=A0A8J8NQ67_HALGN|nr:hypothetical protein FGO68_gene7529 [Halteria grandinella]
MEDSQQISGNIPNSEHQVTNPAVQAISDQFDPLTASELAVKSNEFQAEGSDETRLNAPSDAALAISVLGRLEVQISKVYDPATQRFQISDHNGELSLQYSREVEHFPSRQAEKITF